MAETLSRIGEAPSLQEIDLEKKDFLNRILRAEFFFGGSVERPFLRLPGTLNLSFTAPYGACLRIARSDGSEKIATNTVVRPRTLDPLSEVVPFDRDTPLVVHRIQALVASGAIRLVFASLESDGWVKSFSTYDPYSDYNIVPALEESEPVTSESL